MPRRPHRPRAFDITQRSRRCVVRGAARRQLEVVAGAEGAAAAGQDRHRLALVGIESKESVAQQHRGFRIDGIAPNRDNVKSGKYSYFYEPTMQWHTALFSGLTQDQQDFLSQFRTTASTQDSLAKLSSATQQGVAALPDSYAGAFGTGTTNEIAFGSRVSRGGNSCNPVSHFK